LGLMGDPDRGQSFDGVAHDVLTMPGAFRDADFGHIAFDVLSLRAHLSDTSVAEAKPPW